MPLTIAFAAGPKRIPPRVALIGAVLAMVPDLDVIGFRFGISYDSAWGHRGAMHSLAMAAVLALGMAAMDPALRKRWCLPFLFFAAISHGLLDTMTDGGRGVALFWPLDVTRFFAPWRPIRVSPIGARFFSGQGMTTAISELQWVWLPCLLAAATAAISRRMWREKKGF